MPTLRELEETLRERLDALGPTPHPELRHVLIVRYLERAERIGEFWSYPESRTFAELLIDLGRTRRRGRSRSGCSRRCSGSR
jgi:hypothetical protein